MLYDRNIKAVERSDSETSAACLSGQKMIHSNKAVERFVRMCASFSLLLLLVCFTRSFDGWKAASSCMSIERVDTHAAPRMFSRYVYRFKGA